jgi:streptomycin 6-kinase
MTIESNPGVPEHFARTIVDLGGDAGATWLRNLPQLMAEYERRWSITVGAPYTLSYNYVAPATRHDGTLAVLKLGLPDGEAEDQTPALRHYAGHGMARLLEAEPERGAMLLERLEPGTMLATLVPTDDARATTIAAEVIRDLWQGPGGGAPPAGHPFQSIDDWAAGMGRMRAHFGGGTGPFPRALVEEAEALFADLLASQGAPVLLHGDLHHDNILAAQRAPWLAIDPKGIVGERAYEVGALLRNPLPQLFQLPNPGQATARRVAQLSEELGLDRARVRGWGLAQAVLSAWWSVEDHGHGWEGAIACAELLAAVKV